MVKAPQVAGLPQRWRRAPRRWGHPLHSLCSYFAMFPPQVPHVFIRWLTKPGDVVYDPFAGRGTTPMEACRMGRVGMGSDANPLAYLLTAGKVDAPTTDEARARLRVLRERCVPECSSSAPADIRMLYSDRVLGQLIWLREALTVTRRDDRFLMALLLGVMHANYRPGGPARGLSISMPNTFSMSAGYVRRYIQEHRLVPPDVDVFDLLDRKLDKMHLPEAAATRDPKPCASSASGPGQRSRASGRWLADGVEVPAADTRRRRFNHRPRLFDARPGRLAVPRPG